MRIDGPSPFDRPAVALSMRQIHDLRAPIAVARALLSAISLGAAGPLTETQTDLLGRAETRLEGLQKLVDDLIASGRPVDDVS